MVAVETKMDVVLLRTEIIDYLRMITERTDDKKIGFSKE